MVIQRIHPHGDVEYAGRAWLVHGYNIKDDGASTIDRLRPHLQAVGFAVMDIDYGWRGLLGVRLHNDKTAQQIARLAQPGDVGFGHSNGCAILHQASQLGAGLSGLVYVNPALNKNAVPGPKTDWCHVWHTKHDWTVQWAKFLPFHTWGNMGRVGFRGQDVRVCNFDMSASVSGHSHVFRDPVLREFGPKIASIARAALTVDLAEGG